MDQSEKRLTPRWERAILYGVVVLVIILAIIGLRVAKFSKEPRAISDRFVYSILSGETDDAYVLTAEPFRQATNKESFVEMAKQLDANINSNPVLTKNEIARNSDDILVATMEYEIPGTDGYGIIVKLIRENNQWAVINISNSR